jgi:hypothetical protein
MSQKMKLLAKKLAITFVVTFAAVFLAGAPGLIDAFEGADYSSLEAGAVALALAALAASFRAIVALTTAFVPSDAETGFNLLGEYKP